MNESEPPAAQPTAPLTGDEARAAWISALARAQSERIIALWESFATPPAYQMLRAPEIGLALVRGRAGGSGARFNLGEMSVTRASVVTTAGTTGHAYVAGRKPRHAEIAAVADALLQEDHALASAIRAFLKAEAARRTAAEEARARAVAATRVDFFTLVRGET